MRPALKQHPLQSIPQTPAPRRAGAWTPERRAAQSMALRRWKPWEKSTGPKTAAGKSRSARNAQKHGFRAKGQRMVDSALARQKRWVRSLGASGARYPAGAAPLLHRQKICEGHGITALLRKALRAHGCAFHPFLLTSAPIEKCANELLNAVARHTPAAHATGRKRGFIPVKTASLWL